NPATDHDVFSRWVSSTGTIVSSSYVEQTAEDWRAPRVADDNADNQYLVVAQVGPAGSRFVRGRLADAVTKTLGSAFTIVGISGSDPGEKTKPDVGGSASGGNFLVVWERAFGATDHDIQGKLVAGDG